MFLIVLRDDSYFIKKVTLLEKGSEENVTFCDLGGGEFSSCVMSKRSLLIYDIVRNTSQEQLTKLKSIVFAFIKSYSYSGQHYHRYTISIFVLH